MLKLKAIKSLSSGKQWKLSRNILITVVQWQYQYRMYDTEVGGEVRSGCLCDG